VPDKVDFNEFLKQVDERVVVHAKEEEVHGLLRIGNVWRLNRVEASITKDATSKSDEYELTVQGGPDASRIFHSKVGSADATATEIVRRLGTLTH
jgi:hypothetical protein